MTKGKHLLDGELHDEKEARLLLNLQTAGYGNKTAAYIGREAER